MKVGDLVKIIRPDHTGRERGLAIVVDVGCSLKDGGWGMIVIWDLQTSSKYKWSSNNLEVISEGR